MLKGVNQVFKKGAGKVKDASKATLTRVPTTITAPRIFGAPPQMVAEDVTPSAALSAEGDPPISYATNIAPRPDSDNDSSSYHESDDSYDGSVTSFGVDDKKPSKWNDKESPSMMEKEENEKNLFWCFLLPLTLLLILLMVVLALVLNGNNNNVSQSIVPSIPLQNSTSQEDAPKEVLNPERYGALSKFLIHSGMTAESALTKKGTPQNDALLWLTDNDLAQLEPGDDFDSMDLLQRYALAVFYFSTSPKDNGCEDGEDDECDDKPQQWTNARHWMSKDNVCSWYGVTCDATTNSVRELDLSQNNIHGNIPPELASLSLLETLELAQNSISGTIPAILATMEQLSLLSLGSNKFTGKFPQEFFFHTSISGLFADKNEFTGTLPVEINAANLEALELGMNKFKGKIPKSLWSLPYLRFLHLNHNEFSGSLSDIDTDKSSMQILQLGHNRLSGNISPSLIPKMTNLEYLYLDNNEFEGKLFSTAWRALSNLKAVHLFQNKLTGPIPAEFTSSDLNQLKVLYLDSNKFTGSIPAIKTTKENDVRLSLKEWYIFDNELTGTLPAHTLWALQDSLEDFQFHHQANITGAIPTIMGKLHQLRHLSGHDNHLTGLIPAQLGDFKQLHTLKLYNNDLQGEFPCFGTSLKKVELDCGTNGTILDCDCCTVCYPLEATE